MLAYCGYQGDLAISIPALGVNGAAVHVVDAGGLSLLWSEIEWPLSSADVQRNAIEFHAVISQLFSQTVVVPFRLLTVFESAQSLNAFASEHADDFLADLKRLENTIQMECVVFFKMGANPDRSSGYAYLRQKAEMQRAVNDYSASLGQVLSPLAREIRVKSVNSGSRIFSLLERGGQSAFKGAVESIAVPPGLERRVSGPWPPAEFLSDSVKTPHTEVKK